MRRTMSYNILIGTLEEAPLEQNQIRFDIMAIVNMGKCCYSHEFLKINVHDTRDYYWFVSRNEKRTVDKNGINPKPIPVDKMIEALEKDYCSTMWKPFGWALIMMKTMKKDCDNLHVIVYNC